MAAFELASNAAREDASPVERSQFSHGPPGRFSTEAVETIVRVAPCSRARLHRSSTRSDRRAGAPRTHRAKVSRARIGIITAATTWAKRSDSRRCAGAGSSTPSRSRLFDDLTLLAVSHICDTPFALITLVDADRQWFKAPLRHRRHADVAQHFPFCSHAIEQTGLYIVARRLAAREVSRQPAGDLRAADLASAAGAPLVTPGRLSPRIGALCVADQVPRTLTPGQIESPRGAPAPGASPARSSDQSRRPRSRRSHRDKAEADQQRLVGELQSSPQRPPANLGGLLPYCSVCELNLVIPADPRAIPKITDGVKQILEGKELAKLNT